MAAKLERAIELAASAHAGQTDKAGATYIRHPLRVMEQMDTENERIAAVLHDVVEDTRCDLSTIENEFGSEIREAVAALTKQDDEEYQEFVERAATNEIARKVKRADIEDNMDLTRLSELDQATVDKQKQYHEAWQKLSSLDE
jgi:GTP pyrophosphokinase